LVGVTHHLRRNLVAYLALFVSLSGTSYAASATLLPKNSVGSAQVINRSLQKADLSKKAVTALHGARGPQGSTGAQGPPGPAGVAGTARAFGLVSKLGALSRSKNVANVSAVPADGIFCIALANGIDASQTGLVVTPNYDDDFTDLSSTDGSQAFAEWVARAGDCPAGNLEVQTGIRWDTNAGSPDGDITHVNLGATGQGFFFIVP